MPRPVLTNYTRQKYVAEAQAKLQARLDLLVQTYMTGPSSACAAEHAVMLEALANTLNDVQTLANRER